MYPYIASMNEIHFFFSKLLLVLLFCEIELLSTSLFQRLFFYIIDTTSRAFYKVFIVRRERTLNPDPADNEQTCPYCSFMATDNHNLKVPQKNVTLQGQDPKFPFVRLCCPAQQAAQVAQAVVQALRPVSAGWVV